MKTTSIFTPLIPSPMILAVREREPSINTLYSGLECVLHPGGHCFNCTKYVICLSPGAMNESSNSHSTILSVPWLQEEEGQGKTDNFDELCPIALLHFHTKIPFGRSDAMWITMTVHKPFRKSVGGGFGINFMCRERKYMEKVSVLVRTKCHSSHEGTGSTYQTSPWQVYLRE